MKLLLIIILLGMALAIPVSVLYTQSSAISGYDQGYELINVGDPDEIISDIMGAKGVRIKAGDLSGITWVDSIVSHERMETGSSKVLFRVSGISREVIWEYVLSKEGRVVSKNRIE